MALPSTALLSSGHAASRPLDRCRPHLGRGGGATAAKDGFLGLSNGSPILILIAAFIHLAADAESANVDLRRTASHARARDAFISAFDAVVPDETLETEGNAMSLTTQAEFPVLGSDKGFMGVLTRRAVCSASDERRRKTRVEAAVMTIVQSARLKDPVETVLAAMSPAVRLRLQPMIPGGAFVGYVIREHIGDWLPLSRRKT